jgi:hypothetical protein
VTPRVYGRPPFVAAKEMHGGAAGAGHPDTYREKKREESRPARGQIFYFFK